MGRSPCRESVGPALRSAVNRIWSAVWGGERTCEYNAEGLDVRETH